MKVWKTGRRFGACVSKPSLTNSRTAWCTGVRLMPSRRASSTSLIDSPERMRPAKISARIAWYAASASASPLSSGGAKGVARAGRDVAFLGVWVAIVRTEWLEKRLALYDWHRLD